MDHIAPVINLGGFRLDLSALFMIAITSVAVFVLARLAVRNLSVDNPGKLQNFLEWVVEFVQSIIGQATDYKKGKIYLSLCMALIMYIFVGNLLGLPLGIITEPAHGEHYGHFLGFDLPGAKEAGDHVAYTWWKSPTADASMTMALAIMVIVIAHFQGIRKNGKHYWKHWVTPSVVFTPIHLVELMAKPLTLGLRLFGNIYAGEVMIGVILGLGWVGIPALAVWQGFSVFVGAIQAFVFTMLTMVYISQESIHSEEH
ncbi:F0F1 ATP synthase subunit A [Cohnella panacarvi]|uniref:F0F1 ATP synthase subunit A n=1 Tax=Cohnella panacarvi TaxID=400776 RepID=UPI00047A654C|nr:F0F1 ATP synthase subunit A [Cohnella panacarvi]